VPVVARDDGPVATGVGVAVGLGVGISDEPGPRGVGAAWPVAQAYLWTR
jgi:hypothetical protein